VRTRSTLKPRCRRRKRAEAATAAAATAHTEATSTRERLDKERAEVEGVQQSLSTLISHLEAEVLAAREQRGAEILTIGILRAKVDAEVIASRERELAASREKLAAHQRETLAALQDYPQAHQAWAREMPVELTPGEHIVEAYIAFLETLDRGRRHLERDADATGPVPPWQLFDTPSPQVLAGVLAGINLSFIPGKLATARAWLDSDLASQQTA
jgi:hypothetical protein